MFNNEVILLSDLNSCLRKLIVVVDTSIFHKLTEKSRVSVRVCILWRESE
mgnify:CR=1 FL=1